MIKLTNHFLVSTPRVQDHVFNTSVVYITEHDISNGAVGVIINKPLNKTVKNAFKGLDFGKESQQWDDKLLYLGGPISADNGFILHRSGKRDNQLFELTNNRSALENIVTSGSSELFVSVGYTAWTDYQVENEILRNDWLVVKADQGLIFDVAPHNRYQEALNLLGVSNIGQVYCNTFASA